MCKRRRFRFSNGFTIVELVLVVSLVAIMAVSASTRINVSQKKLDAVTKTIRSDIQYAQDLAMTQGQKFGFVVWDNYNYSIFQGNVLQAATDPLSRGNFNVNISPVRFNGLQPLVTFDRNGKPTLDFVPSGLIQLTDGTVARTLTVEPNTGFVTIVP